MMTSSASMISIEMTAKCVIKQVLVPNVENLILLGEGLSLKYAKQHILSKND